MSDRERATLIAVMTTPTRDLIRRESLDRRCSVGELVEAAMLVYLQPGTKPETDGLVFARLLAIEETLAQVLGTLEALVNLAEAERKKPVPPPIATYGVLYTEETSE